jgi:type VI secretion system protein ImpJ
MAEAQMFDRIKWHEGMLLTPQHFQQESARVDALVAWQSLAGQPAAWGIRRLVIDDAILGRNRLRIELLEAIMPNGMAVCFDATRAQDATLELDLAPYAAAMAQGDVPVYLVIGTARSLRLPGQPAMFRPVESGLVEDEVTTAQAEVVPRMAARLALAAGNLPGSAYVALQLMTVRQDNQIVRRGAFWPAQLEVPAGSHIAQRARALAAVMRSKAVFLGKQSMSQSSRLEERVALIEQRARLAQLTCNLPLLEATLDLVPLQPLALYLALCAQLGPLAALRPGAVPLAPPAYLHADSQPAFDAVLDHLHGLAAEVSQEWTSIPFNFDGEVFSLAMRPAWLGTRLVLGLRGHDDPELRKWMTSATIGSRTVSASLRDRRVPGAPRQAIEAAPELGLRDGGGAVLFAVTVDTAFIVTGQDLLIGNDNSAQRALRPQEIVVYVKGQADEQ